MVARLGGADVWLAEVNSYRRHLAARLGIKVLDPATDDIAAVVAQWTCNAGVSLSFEVSGAPAGIAAAVDSLAVRGRLCVVAIHPVPREMNLHRFFWRELTLVAHDCTAGLTGSAQLLLASSLSAALFCSRGRPW